MATYEVKVDVGLNQSALSASLNNAFAQIAKFVSQADKTLGNIGNSIKSSNISGKISEGLDNSLGDIQAFVQVANEEFDKLAKDVDLSNVRPPETGTRRTAPAPSGGGGGSLLQTGALLAGAGAAAGALSEIPKSLKASISEAKGFEKTLTLMKTQATGFKRILKSYSEEDHFKAIGQSAKSAGKQIEGALLVTKPEDVTSLLGYKKALDATKKSINATAQASIASRKSTEVAKNAYNAYRKAIKRAGTSIDTLKAKMEDTATRLPLIGGKLKSVSARFESLKAKLTGLAGRIPVVGESLSKLVGNLNKTALAGAAAVVGILAVSAAMSKLALSQLAVINGQQKFADRMGESVNDIRLLETATKLAGGSAEGLQDAMKNVSERIADAFINKSGTAFDAMKKLGLSIDEVNKLSASEQLLVVRDALSEVENAGERAFLAMEIGQDSFFELGNMIGLSKDEMSKLLDKSGELTKALSGPQQQAIKGLNDSWAEFKLLITQFAQDALVQLAPMFKAIVIEMVAFFNAAKESGSLQFLIDLTKVTAGAMFGLLKAVSFVADGLMRTFALINSGTKLALAGLAALANAASNLVGGGDVLDVDSLLGDAEKDWEAATRPVDNASKVIEEANKKIIASFNKTRDAFKAGAKNVKEVKFEMPKSFKEFFNVEEVIKADILGNKITSEVKALKDNTAIKKALEDVPEKWRGAFKQKLEKEFGKLERDVSSAVQINKIVNSMGKTFSKSGDAISRGLSDISSLKGTEKGLLSDIELFKGAGATGFAKKATAQLKEVQDALSTRFKGLKTESDVAEKALQDLFKARGLLKKGGLSTEIIDEQIKEGVSRAKELAEQARKEIAAGSDANRAQEREMAKTKQNRKKLYSALRSDFLEFKRTFELEGIEKGSDLERQILNGSAADPQARQFESQKKELDEARAQEKIERDKLIESNAALTAANKSLSTVFDRARNEGVTLIGKGI